MYLFCMEDNKKNQEKEKEKKQVDVRIGKGSCAICD